MTSSAESVKVVNKLRAEMRELEASSPTALHQRHSSEKELGNDIAMLQHDATKRKDPDADDLKRHYLLAENLHSISHKPRGSTKQDRGTSSQSNRISASEVDVHTNAFDESIE